MLELLIGPRRYSTWSLRGWLIMRATGAAFTLRHGRYATEADREALRRVSPSGFVPALWVDGEMIWDTLSIAEWAAETYPEARLWPADPITRAKARSVTAEMHSSFTALRTQCSMGPNHHLVGEQRSPPPTDPAVARDVERLVDIFRTMRARYGAEGPWLFGGWSIADAFFTALAARLRHFQIDVADHGDVDGVAKAYLEALLQQPDVLLWTEQALAEGES